MICKNCRQIVDNFMKSCKKIQNDKKSYIAFCLEISSVVESLNSVTLAKSKGR